MRSTLATRTALGFAVSLAFAFPTTSRAIEQTPGETDAGCNSFAWTVENERAWFAEKDLRRVASGVRLSRIDRAVALELVPTRSVEFFLRPKKTPPPDSFSGQVAFFGVPRPGLYQVSISGDASIDVFENGTRLAAVAETEARDCRSVRRSERFTLAPGDLVLVQISGALEPSIKVAFEEVAEGTGSAAQILMASRFAP